MNTYPSQLYTAASKKGVGFTEILVFLIPAVQFLEIEIVGRLFASDIMLLSLFPVLFFSKGGCLRNKDAKIYIVLGLLWLGSQVATDLILNTPFEDFARGWAKIGLYIIHFMVLYMLFYEKTNRIFYFAAGMVAGGLIDYFITPNIYAAAHPWKFGYGSFVSLFLMLMTILLFGYRKKTTWIVILLISFLNLYMGSRGTAGVYFLTVVFIFLVNRYDFRKYTGINIHLSQLIPLFLLSLLFLSGIFLILVEYPLAGITCLFLTISVYLFRQSYIQDKGSIIQFLNKLLVFSMIVVFISLGFYQTYKFAAAEGLLGPEASQKLHFQTGRYGSFVGGRSGILISLKAIADSPVIGHGSWAKDMEYVRIYNYVLDELGYNKSIEDSALIPTHSHLFGAWVNSGFLGAVFWGWILFFLIKSLIQLTRTGKIMQPLLAFFCFGLVWSVLFSPYGAKTRFIETYQIAAIMTFLLPYAQAKTHKIVKESVGLAKGRC